MIKTLLFASDFTSITSKAERYALEIAGATGARVTILHAVEPIADSAGDAGVQKFLDHKQQQAKRNAEAVAERFRARGVECDVFVEIGKRWQSIVDAARSGGYDMIVLGSHKSRDGDEMYLGTTTHKVFFSTDVPLLVVPAE